MKPSYVEDILTFLLCAKRAREQKIGVLAGVSRDIATLIGQLVKKDAKAKHRQYRVYYALSVDVGNDLQSFGQHLHSQNIFDRVALFASDEAGTSVRTYETYDLYDARDHRRMLERMKSNERSIEAIFDCGYMGGYTGIYEIEKDPPTTSHSGVFSDGFGRASSIDMDTPFHDEEYQEVLKDIFNTHTIDWSIMAPYYEMWINVKRIKL